MDIASPRRRVETTKSTWRLHHLTDLHVDQPDHAPDHLAAKIKEIQDDEYALWLGGGDYGGLILPGDPRAGDGWAEGVPPARVADWCVETISELLMPIRHQCIGFGIGNHERTVMAKWHRGVGAEIANNLGVSDLYLGLRGWSCLSFDQAKGSKTMTLKIYWYHGWSAGRSKSAKVLQEERDLGAWNADVFMLGHNHQPHIQTWYTEEPYHASKTKKWMLRTRPRAFINGGAWTWGQREPRKFVDKLPSEWPNEYWVELKNFRPEPPRSPVLEVHVDLGRGKQASNRDNGRAQGFSFTEMFHQPVFER